MYHEKEKDAQTLILSIILNIPPEWLFCVFNDPVLKLII